MNSASKNLFFHLFSVNCTTTRKGHGQGLASLCQNSDNSVFLVYTESWMNFKPHYFLITPTSPVAHFEFHDFPISASGPACTNRARRFWSSDHFEKNVGFYSIPYGSSTAEDRKMKVVCFRFLAS